MNTDTLNSTDNTQTADATAVFTITDSAAEQVRAIMEKENALDHRLRIGVASGGCSMMSADSGVACPGRQPAAISGC